VKQAVGMGIQVIELPSTAAAKAWVDENEGEDEFSMIFITVALDFTTTRIPPPER